MVSARIFVATASIVVLGSVGVVACGGSTPEPNDVPVTGTKLTPRGSVSRQAVVEAVDAGLGAFLQRIQVEPVTRDGAYLGFQLKAIDPAGGWSAYDIQVGDIVTHANGKSLEAEATAFEVFQELRSAKEIKLNLIRDGAQRLVVIPIVGEAKAVEPGQSTQAAESAASVSATSG